LHHTFSKAALCGLFHFKESIMGKVPAMQTGNKGAVGAMTTGTDPAMVPVKPAGGKPAAAKPAGKKSGKAKSRK
jgi:hypothetical protein